MSRKRGRSDSRYSELQDLEYKYYTELRDGKVRIDDSGKYLLCPYCQHYGRKEYDSLELERHASRIARESKSASFRDKARHRGLLKYLDRYGHMKGKLARSNTPKHSVVYQDYEGISAKSNGEDALLHASPGASEPGEIVIEEGKVAAEVKDCKSRGGTPKLDLEPLSCAAVKRSSKGDDEPIVWPWMAVIVNIPVEKKDGRYVGESGGKLREKLVTLGYNPIKVHPLWNVQGHSGFAIVDFNKDWEGFKNAMAFEKAFEMDHRGKRDWYGRRNRRDELYGWLAREDDFRGRGIIGTRLRKNGDLKTLSDIQRENERKDTSLMCNLSDQLQSKSKECEDVKKNISKTESLLGNIMDQKEKMVEHYNEEMKKMQDSAADQLRKISDDHKRSITRLESRRQELRLRERDLKQRQALNESEKRELNNQKKLVQMNEMAITEQKKADEKMLKLANEQKREKELLHKKIIELEVKLDQKQALELHIERMRGAVEVMKHMTNSEEEEEEDVELKKKLESIEEELKDNEEELDAVETLYQTLVIKERKTNDEVQQARKELIKIFNDSHANICVKRMGALDTKSFIKAAKIKLAGEDVEDKAAELCSLWDDHLRDPSWHPYKMIKVGENTHKEVLDENDQKLKELKTDLGDEVYYAVTTALNEMNEYNPSGRYPVMELWNSAAKRKASLAEASEYMLNKLKTLKGKGRRTRRN